MRAVCAAGTVVVVYSFSLSVQFTLSACLLFAWDGVGVVSLVPLSAGGQGLSGVYDRLVPVASAAARRASARFSGFHVGAAGMCVSGEVVSGCNVESASFGVTLCAECGMVSALVAAGLPELTHVVVVDEAGADVSPCGRCRQLLVEFCSSDAVLLVDGGAVLVSALLPGAFDLPGV